MQLHGSGALVCLASRGRCCGFTVTWSLQWMVDSFKQLVTWMVQWYCAMDCFWLLAVDRCSSGIVLRLRVAFVNFKGDCFEGFVRDCCFFKGKSQLGVSVHLDFRLVMGYIRNNNKRVKSQ